MVEILVGPICSGKSTFTRRRAAAGAVVVNDDAIVTAVHGGDYTLYSKALKPLYKQVEMCLIAGAASLGRDVVIDRANNMSPACRRKYVGFAKAIGQEVVAVVFPNAGPAEHARRRFAHDARGLTLDHWVKAAGHHEAGFATPDQLEGIDRVVSLAERLAELDRIGDL